MGYSPSNCSIAALSSRPRTFLPPTVVCFNRKQLKTRHSGRKPITADLHHWLQLLFFSWWQRKSFPKSRVICIFLLLDPLPRPRDDIKTVSQPCICVLSILYPHAGWERCKGCSPQTVRLWGVEVALSIHRAFRFHNVQPGFLAPMTPLLFYLPASSGRFADVLDTLHLH